MDEFDELEAAYQRSLLPPEERDTTPAPVQPLPPADLEEVTLSRPWSVEAQAIRPSSGETHELEAANRLIALHEERIRELEAQIANPVEPVIDTHILENTAAYDIHASNIIHEFWGGRIFWIPLESFRSFCEQSPATEGELISEKVLWPSPGGRSVNYLHYSFNQENERYVQVKVYRNTGSEIYLKVYASNSADLFHVSIGDVAYPFVLKVAYSEINSLMLRSFNTASNYSDDYGWEIQNLYSLVNWELHNTHYLEYLNRERSAIEGRNEFKEEIRGSLDLAYPGKWDFLDIDTCSDQIKRDITDQVGSSNIGSSVIPIIKFDHITITNKEGRSRELENLFVCIPFKMYEDGNFKPTGRLLGTRTSVTGNEYRQRYMHSHLPSGFGSCSSFCLGGGTPMSVMMSDLSMDFDMLKFDFLLSQLDSYVRYESLEGGPHIRMEGIDSESYETSVSSAYCREYYNKFLDLCSDEEYEPNINIDVKTNNFSIDILDVEFQDKVLPLIESINHKASLNPDGTFMPLEGNARNYIPSAEDTDSFSISRFTFRGEAVIGEILPNNTVDENPSRIVPCKQVLEYISKRVSMDTQSYLLMKTEDEHS